MTAHYTYTTSIDFINDLAFEYIETYSFQRGQEFEADKRLMQAEYDRLKDKKITDLLLSANEEERLLKLDGLLGCTQYLINDKGAFHYSSKRINIFQVNNPVIERLKSILRTEITNIPMWLCSPIYRDAIVFYNSDHTIVSTLHVCLSCQYMETTMFNHINGDHKTYDFLKRFFIDIGHEVENQ